MLSVWLGACDNAQYGPSWFKYNYHPDWLRDPFVQDMIRDVDKSEYVDGLVINSPVLGPIPPERLSGGVQTLIMIYERPDLIFNATSCGENCAKWLMDIGRRKDVTVLLQYMMPIYEQSSFKIKLMNEDRMINSADDYVITAMKYI